jgi:uncharacterized protein YjbI with pentapeptide repeats
MDLLKEYTSAVTSLAAIIAAVVSVFKYFAYQTKRDKIRQIRETFNAVVKSLSSTDEVERTAGAILLRRFFDAKSEVGTAGIPYAKEAVNVSAAILRGQSTGNFQKLLADGLAFAPSLARADLQRTNLQEAYLGERTTAKGKREKKITTNLQRADFYRADLSRASLKKAKARGAVFYQTRMHGTVLTDADLCEGNFFGADLKDAKFDGAHLSGAKFGGARNIPAAIVQHLDEAQIYTGADPFVPPQDDGVPAPLKIFISKPGCTRSYQQYYVTDLMRMLDIEGMTPQSLERRDYPPLGIFGEVQQTLNDCVGAVIFGFKELDVRDAVWRAGTMDERVVRGESFSTPWSHIEAGMACMLELPLLVIAEDVSGGVFDTSSGDRQIYRVRIEEGWRAGAFGDLFVKWSADVRERARLLAGNAAG